MPIIRRALTVAAVTAAGTLAFALPASAHSADFQRDCDQVTLTLNNDFPQGTYTIDVFRDTDKIDEFSYTVGSGDTKHMYKETNEDVFTYHITWDRQDGKDKGTSASEKKYPPKNCTTPPATPTDTPTSTPPAKPVSAPTTSAPAAAPTATPSQAVEADKLANTGAGNTVPLVVVGAVLVAGGVGLTFVTRRRRSGSTTS